MPVSTSIEQIFSLIESGYQLDRPVIITLSGPSGSGKTTMLDRFLTNYGSNCTVISTDDYYIGKTLMRSRMPQGQTENFDHPSAIDTKRLANDLQKLIKGQSIEKPVYDMKQSEPKAYTEAIQTNKIIIVEGIAANLPELRKVSDLSLLVTAPLEERLRRRIDRDTVRKGYSPSQTRSLFMSSVEPSYQKYYASHDSKVDYQISSMDWLAKK